MKFLYERIESYLCEAWHRNVKVFTCFIFRLCNHKTFVSQDFLHIQSVVAIASHFCVIIFGQIKQQQKHSDHEKSGTTNSSS